MSVCQKRKDAQGRNIGPWFMKYPIGRDPLTGKIKYKSEKVGYQKKLAERVCQDLEKAFGPMLIKDIKPAMVEKYQSQRLQEPTRYENPRSTANVNRTIAVLKRMFNLAVREELADKNPCWKIKMLSENNSRDRILSVEELELLMKHLPPHAAQVVHFAYRTGTRAGEIFNLTWDKVDFPQKLVGLEAEDTKTLEPRVVFLCDRAYDILKTVGKIRSLDHNRVFTYRGRPLKKIKKAFTGACRKAGIVNFRFHDLRHTFNTNMRKAGVDQSVIMKLTGHKTPSMFQRYNTVDVDDAKSAYRRLEEFLSKEQDQNAARTKKCSHGAPGERS